MYCTTNAKFVEFEKAFSIYIFFNSQQLKYAYNKRIDIVLESSILYILILMKYKSIEAMNKTINPLWLSPLFWNVNVLNIVVTIVIIVEYNWWKLS